MCSGDWILMKDVDELYHHDSNFHKMVELFPGYTSYSVVMYDMYDENQYRVDARITAHHRVPRMFKTGDDIKFAFENNDSNGSGVDWLFT